MATIVLGGIGALVGSSLGGPAGARLGFSIGATIGSWIDGQNNQPRMEIGKLDDLRFSGSSYGSTIALTWKAARPGGIVIWAAEDANGNHLVEHQQSTGGGGGGSGGGGGGSTTEYWYSSTFAVAFRVGTLTFPNGDQICRAVTLKRLYADDVIVYDSSKPGDENKLKLDVDFFVYEGTEDQDPSPIIVAHSGLSADRVCAFRGVYYIAVQDMNLREFGNRIPNWSAEFDGDDVTTGEYISDRARMSGLLPAQIEVDGCTVDIGGVTITDIQSPSDDLGPFCRFYGIGMADIGGQTVFKPRGATVVATIPAAELGASSGGGNVPTLKRRRRHSRELPGRVEVQYMDLGTSLQRGTQSSTRPTSESHDTMTVTLPLALTADEAQQGADRRMDEEHESLEDVEFSLSLKFMELAPEDAVLIPINGVNQRVRIHEASMAPIGEIRFKGVREGADAYVQSGTGSTGGGVQPPPPSPVPSIFRAWSGKELRDEDQVSHGFYVAATGGPGWQGGRVWYSVDETTWVNAAAISSRSVFGVSTSTLSASGAVANAFDDTNDVDVDVSASGGALASVSDDEILNGVNHAVLGDEILGVGTVDLTGPGEYTLSHLRRGERDSAMSGHSSSDLFVLLSSGVVRVAVPSSYEGETVYVRVVSAYQEISDVTSETVVIAERTPTQTEELQEPSYVTLGTNATLANERVLTAGAGIHIEDGGAGGAVTLRGVIPVATKTGNYSLTKDDGLILSNHSAAVTYTLPAVSGGGVPPTGKVFEIRDRSSAGAGTYNITVAVPSGAEIDGATNGTLVLAGNKASCQIVFDGTEYWTIRAKGVMTLNDLASSWNSRWGTAPGTGFALPTSGSTRPCFLPFMFDEDVSVDQIIFPFATAPSSDATTARARIAFYESSSFRPGNLLYASEDFVLQGSGHVRSTTNIDYTNTGSVCAAVGVCTLSTRRYFKGNTLYYMAVHFEGNFTASTAGFNTDRGATQPALRLTSDQAWPYSFGNSPAVQITDGSHSYVRFLMILRHRRIADIS